VQAQLPAIAKGRAVLTNGELRCAAPHRFERPCNKLIVKANVYGHIAGSFQCERCKERIEVRMVPAGGADVSTARGPAVGKGSKQYPRFGETPQTRPNCEVSPQ
jgi:phage FluMu protein Com